jgi:hypothetical protein
MIKRLLQFVLMLGVCIGAHAQSYNAIATAYVVTTISQNVVFDSNMQAGGTFTFSVLAHNGGGRAGQSDTANVRIQFYNASGAQVGATAQTNYSSNLPNPNASAGNPAIDTSVPWSTLTVSATLSAADAANVAYARVSMYGIDGSYWAGDYGPWYRAPTFQHNGSGNLTYNPEFGPYNGITAQGWTSSPGFGACQGAWGGSNACIVNSDGVPGSSTVGLVANANGGGPSATGGTTSGTAGGYNSTMSVTNAGTGATAGAPPPATTAPTVTGTSVTYTYRSVVTSPGVTSVYKTAVTTTNYSDGTSTSSNGTETLTQTKVASTVVTNKIVNGVLTVYTTPIYTVTDATTGVKTVEANGAVTTTTQNVQTGLNYQVWRYDYNNYSCGWLGCVKIPFSYRTPSTNVNDYGNTVRSGTTNSGMYLQTNGRLPNGDGSLLGYNEGTVVRYTGTITAPITQAYPAGTVYRLYFYNQTDDGFVLNINGGRIITNSTTYQWQAIGNNYNGTGWMDVVAGQSYNLEAWYWNVEGGVGHRFFWNYGAGIMSVPNSAFSTGWITETNTIDTTGKAYSNPNVVNVSGTSVALGPTVEGGTITMTNGTGQEIITSGISSSAGLDTNQQTRVDAWNNAAARSSANAINLDVNGSNNSLYIEQVGNSNVVKGIGEVPARVTGSSNAITVKQGTMGAGQNEIQMRVIGDGNTLDIGQARNNMGAETGTNGHYQAVDINGYQNTLTTQQSNTTLGGHYQETTINGNQNNVTKRQTDNGNKIMFTTITGNSNTVDAVQKGTGQHQLTTNLTGNNNSALVVQEGAQQNKANIDLTNAGGPAILDLQQSGGKNFTIIQSCTNPAGCTTTVRQ